MYGLMFRTERLDMTRPSLHEAATASFEGLASAVGAGRNENSEAEALEALSLDQAAAIARAWSLVHGFTTLLLDGRLKDILHRLPEGTEVDQLLDAMLRSTVPRPPGCKLSGERKLSPRSGVESRMARASRAPWKRSNPRKRAGKKSKHLTPAQKSTAKARARRAGRPYPNLVDNMRMASKASKKKAAKKSPAKKDRRQASRPPRRPRRKLRKKKAAQETAARARQGREKDPKGGLTAAGRTAFARRDGSHLKPGVTKSLVRDDAAGHAPQRQLGGGFTAARNCRRWSMAGEGRRGMRCRPMPGASRSLERSQRRGASPLRANGCCERYRRIKQKA